MDTTNILAIVGAAIGSPTAFLLARKAWILLRQPRADLLALEKKLDVERAARLAASAECDARLTAAIRDADQRLANAMARMEARNASLEQRLDLLTEKRVTDQKASADMVAEVSRETIKSIDLVGDELRAVHQAIDTLPERLLRAIKGPKGVPDAP